MNRGLQFGFISNERPATRPNKVSTCLESIVNLIASLPKSLQQDSLADVSEPVLHVAARCRRVFERVYSLKRGAFDKKRDVVCNDVRSTLYLASYGCLSC